MIHHDRAQVPGGMTRRRVCAAGATLLAAVSAHPAIAQDASAEKADFLFVQTAKGMAFDADQSRLTLRDVSPVTLFFSDRPDRIAGNMSTTRFVPFWSEAPDSFKSDPPNADMSIVENGELRQVVVELRDPVLEGGDLHYTVKLIDGVMPEMGEEVSLFIDIIGMPRTPLSFAGARRRTFRRAVIY